MTILYIAIIILVICALICFSIFTDEDNKDSEDYVILALKQFAVMCMILISVILTAYYTTEPTAMDVYQGETTIEITYKDGVPVDSVVVWKGGVE